MTNKNLEGRIALITGGARGIGKAISENLAQQGCNIIIFDPGYSISGNHDDKNLAERISEEINKKYNVKTLAITKDVSLIEDVKNSIDLILNKFASIDIVINNAAIIEVNFVKKVPTVLADVKLSCETPRPKAPPSDLCKSITIIKITAKAILTNISKLSMMLIYSNSLLYQ